jgi:hypothetical protein
MVVHDAESQAPRTRTNQKARKPSPDGGQRKRTRRNSQDTQSESITSGRDDRTGGNSSNSTGDVPPGGTIERLITDTLSEIQEIDVRREKLCKRVTDLQGLLNGLQNKSEEKQ